MKSNKLTIIIPHLSHGGAEKVTYNLIKNILFLDDQKNIDIELLLLKQKDSIIEQDTKQKIASIADNIKVKYLPFTKISLCLPYLLRYLYLNRDRKYLCVSNHVNLIILICNFLLFRVCDIYITIHDNFKNEVVINPSKINKLIDYLIGVLYPKAAKIICVSEGIVEIMRTKYNISSDNLVRIYNPVLDEDCLNNSSKNKISHLHKWLDYPRNYPVFLSVGSLREQKNFELLIKSFSIVNQQIPDSRLIILGEGPLRNVLESLICKLRLVENVDLVGFSTRVSDFMRLADVYVLSSKTEALPTVLIEALSEKMKIVSVDCEVGPREILKNGYFGLLVDNNSPRSLADGMLSSLSTNLQYNDAELSSYLNAFSNVTATKKYLQVLNMKV